MITVEHERPQDGAGPGFFDAVSIDFCDAEHELFGLIRVARHPGQARTSALGLLFARGELVSRKSAETQGSRDDWRQAEVDGISTTTEAPLEGWRAALLDGDTGFELEARATSSPLDLNEGQTGAVAEAAGVDRYEQICTLGGQVRVKGRSISIHCLGRRQHAWGAYDWRRVERWRSIYAASEARGISVVSTRPAGSAGHGDELRSAQLVTGGEPPLAFEEVRISTVFGSDRLPAKAGLELFMPEDEYPKRVTGQALCAATVDDGGEPVQSVSFFRWSLDGEPALGAYETLESR
jgi:hypothetical protein